MSEFRTVRLAAAQAASVFLDRDASVEKACQLIEEAGGKGVDLIGFPECFIPGHPVWYYHHPVGSPESAAFAERLFHNSVEVPSDATDALCEAAKKANCVVVMGINERMSGTTGTMFNTQLFIGRNGEILGKHQKLVATVGERLVHAPGSGASLRTFDTDMGPIGGLICGENSNPLALYELMRENMRIHVASWPPYFSPNWPTKMSEGASLVGRGMAYTAKAFVINACSTPSGEMYQMATSDTDKAFMADAASFGGSTIIAPDGSVLAGPAGTDEEILYADADLGAIVRGKMVHDFAGHYQRHDVFQFDVRDVNAPAEPGRSRRRVAEVDSVSGAPETPVEDVGSVAHDVRPD